MMKKIIALCLVFAVFSLSFTFTACKKDDKTYSENEFYDSEKWGYMTVNGGKSDDAGETPTTLEDGSIKFFNANQVYAFNEDVNEFSFLLNTTKDWQIWLKCSSKDNAKVNCYKLFFKDETLHVKTSENSADLAYASASDCSYVTTKWNKISVSFSLKENNERSIKIVINDTVAPLTIVNDEDCAINGNDLVYREKEDFVLGNFFAVKVWGGDCILRLKPLSALNTPDSLKIACIGDSITYGANADNPYTDSYPVILQKLYGKEACVINFGNSGKTVRNNADDPYFKTSEYNGISLYKPDIAVIILGTNDSKTYQVPTKSEMVNAYKKLIEALKSVNPAMQIYMATCPYAFSSAYQINNKNIENVVIPAIREVAAFYDLQIIEMHEYTKDYSHLYADGIHPNTKGYSYLAYRVYCDLESLTPDESYIATFKK